jgi:hypothetical protein
VRAARAVERVVALQQSAGNAAVTALLQREEIVDVQILEAMLAAASDDTEGDRALAAVVYVVAATTGDPMADNVRTGRIKVDEVDAVAPGRLAEYGAVATHEGGKGDTMIVPASFDIDNLAYRGAIVHELRHAAQDASAEGATFHVAEFDKGEAEAYHAGARFELAQVADMSVFARVQAVRQLGAVMNGPKLLAMIVESQADPDRFAPIVEAVNAAWREAIPHDQLRAALRQPASKLEPILMSEIRGKYGISPETNTFVLDDLAGENVFDTEDRF